MSWRREGSRKARTCYVVVSLRERRRKGSVFPKNGEREARSGKAGKKGHGRKNAKTLYVWGESLIYNHSGDNGRKDPPVPIPNTEVKLSRAESTCRDTDREDRSSPLFNFFDCRKRQSEYCSLAQSVEHRTVNPSVVSSSLTGAAKKGDTNTFMFVSPFSRF